MTEPQNTPAFSHVDAAGAVRMVDVGSKPVTRREAKASALVRMQRQVLDSLMAGALPKGDALATARVAGIAAAKRTSEWIPMCHTLPLDAVALTFDRVGDDSLRITCSVCATARTGVEMEALTGAAAAGLCLYDMAKSADRSMSIGPIRLESKSGGRSGDFSRDESC